MSRRDYLGEFEHIVILARGIAHDFDNPLPGILGNASLLLEDLDPLDPSRGSLEDIGAARGTATDICDISFSLTPPAIGSLQLVPLPRIWPLASRCRGL